MIHRITPDEGRNDIQRIANMKKYKHYGASHCCYCMLAVVQLLG